MLKFAYTQNPKGHTPTTVPALVSGYMLKFAHTQNQTGHPHPVLTR